MLKRLLSVLVFTFTLACGSHAQGTPYQLDPPAPNAILRACSFPVTGGNPCSNPATIYSDSALTQVIVQPVQLGDSGNLIFYYSSGPLMLQLTGSVNRSILVAGGGGGGTPGGSNTQVQFNNSSAFGGDPNFTYATSTGLLSHVNPGVFDNTAMHQYNQFFVPSTCNPTAIFQAGGSSYFLTDALSSCLTVPSSSVSNGFEVAIDGYTENDNSCTTCSALSGPAGSVGIQGVGYAAVNNAMVWGVSGGVRDKAGNTGNSLFGAEIDASVFSTSTKGYGVLWAMQGTAQPTGDNFPAFAIQGATGSQSTTGFECQQGSLYTSSSTFGSCLYAEPQTSSNGVPSYLILFGARNSGGTLLLKGLQLTAKGVLQTGAPIGPQVTTVGSLPSASSVDVGAMIIVTDATTFTVGTCTGGGSDVMIAVSNGTTWSCH